MFPTRFIHPLLAVIAFIPVAGNAAAEVHPGFAGNVRPFFEEYCIRCHGPEKAKGKITLHTLDAEFGSADALKHWEEVLNVLTRGDMPPDDEPQPPAEHRQAVATWIRTAMKAAVSAEQITETSPLSRRLTNVEYENTIRDLMGFRLNLAVQLPPDPVVPYAFNNTAELMRLGPEQIDRYLDLARQVMAAAIVDPGTPTVKRVQRQWDSTRSESAMGFDEVGVRGNGRHSAAHGIGVQDPPTNGEFLLRVKASAILPAGIEEVPLRIVMGYGLNVNSSTLAVEPIGMVHLRNSPDHPETFEFRGRIENFPVEPGPTKDGKVMPGSLFITPQNLYDDGTLNDQNGFRDPRAFAFPRAVVHALEFEVPVVEPWPPAHHTRILFPSPLRESDPEAYLAEVLKRFASRAFRRPATPEEIERFTRLHQLIAPDFDTLEGALRETLAMMLISPQFLFHSVAAQDKPLQYELASRLSYFLWASMPDETLLHLAAEGRLTDDAVMHQQVMRMLQDERANDFVRAFTMQWMSLDKMKTVPINRDIFPRFLYYVPLGERAGTEVPYRPTIRDYMIEETVAFVGELLRRNAPVFQIVDSDFAMLNQPLAAHYGVEGVHGLALRPVRIAPEHQLGGLLTHGSVLIGNGTGTAPHPIYRAVWLREAILGDEVAPPPAEVPALTDSAGESAEKALTIKDLLARHRTMEGCNDCHVRLDPWGIPFEQYNAIGHFQPMVPREGVRVKQFDPKAHGDLLGYVQYLTSINTERVEADARVPNGPEINGMRELKSFLLSERRPEIAENVLRRLLSYALGRKLTYRDRFAVEAMLEQAGTSDYALRDMIMIICTSELFANPR